MIPRDLLAHQLGERFPSTRVLRLIERAITGYQLDLEGLTVLTEAATGYYRLTPIIAALAGARAVVAVARDSTFGTTSDAFAQVRDLAEAAGVEGTLELRADPSRDLASMADLITNLGAVRPIEESFIRNINDKASVSLMFGACDARPADLSVIELRKAGVPICGVDEAAIDLFRWTGLRITWWMIELGLELVGSTLLIWGDSAPAERTARWLEQAGAVVRHLRGPRPPGDQLLKDLDGLILMERGAHISEQSSLTPTRLAQLAKGVAILEYSGSVDRVDCFAAGLTVYPPDAPRAGHVSRTIGEILYAPVIELHTAGLRVGELMTRARLEGLSAADCEQRACDLGPGEALPS